MEGTASAMRQVLTREGETLAFEEFFEAEGPRLFRAMRLLTGNTAEAEDCCQDAFFRVWLRWDRVGTMESPSGYLYRTALNGYRRRSRRAIFAARQALRIAPPDDPGLSVEARDTCARWFAALTPRQRTAVVLTEILAASTEEAAAVMHVKPGTVHALLSQARAALRRSMETPDV